MRSAIRASEFRRIPFLDRIVTVVQAENFDLKEAKSDALKDPPMSASCGEAKPFGLSSPTKEKQKNGETCRERCCVTKNATRGTRVAILSILTRSHVDEPLNRLVTPTTTGVCFFFLPSWLVFTALSLFIVTHPRRSSRLWPRSRTTWIHCTRRKTMRSTPRRPPTKKSRSSAFWTNCATSGHCSTRLTLTNKGNARSQCYASCCWPFYFGK